MALDHSRLGLENKFLEKKSGRMFCFRQVYFTTSWQQIWVCKPAFYTFCTSHLRYVKQYYLSCTDLGKMQYFTIFQDKLYSVNIEDDQSWAFSETLQKISKITYTVSRFSLLTSAKFAWTLIELRFNIIKNLLSLFFLFKGFITMCNLKKHLWTTENKRHSDENCKRDY